ncbi:MAG: hypothetical protein ACOYVF_07505 [Candidatus Zixiibacteriota bacterium]
MKKTANLTMVFLLGLSLFAGLSVQAQSPVIYPGMTEEKSPPQTVLSEDASLFCPSNSTIYGHTPDGPSSSWSIGFTDKYSGYLLFDNFSAAGIIKGLHFWGVTAVYDGGFSPCPENPQDFGFVFSTDDAGYPGDPVAWRYATITGEPTGLFYGSFELYEYEVWFDEPVSMEEGWLNIYGTGGDIDCWFGWLSGNGGDDHAWHYYSSTYNDYYYDLAFCLLYEGCPEGVDVFGQPPDFPAEIYTMTSDDGMAQQYCVYDNFSSLSHVGSIHFWGIQGHFDGGWYACDPPENPMNFEINFYNDAGGTPGALLYSFTKTLTGQPTGIILYSTYEIYEFQTQFPQIPMSSGWLSVQGIDFPDCWYLVISSRSGYDDHCYQWDGMVMADRTYDMAMCLMEICCTGVRGNVNCSDAEEPDISDITRLIDYLYISHAPLCCSQEADTNASGGEPDISDITRLIDFLYISHAPMGSCY